MNMVTHIVGGGIGVIGLVLCVIKAALNGNVYGVVGASIYGASMVALYSMSSIYHGVKPGFGKLVMQVLDHCTIYFLIAGTYTVLCLSAIRPVNPYLGWGLFGFQWGMGALAITLTAIDLKKYNVFSMICYIGMGWAVIPFTSVAIEALTMPGFQLLLWGGIAYSIGAILFGIGSRIRWTHSVFHIFVVIGTFLQFLSIFLYGL